MAGKLDNKIISSWVRQARYRAKRYDIYSDLTIADVQAVVESSQELCAYCGKEAETLDCPFPLKEHAPNTPANVVLACRACKEHKKNQDLVWMFSAGHLTQEQYLKILQDLFKRRGGDKIREHVRRVTGLIDEDG